MANMKSRRRRFGLVQYKSKLYALGGFLDSFGELRACEIYEAESNTWESIASMKTNRCDLGVAVLSGMYGHSLPVCLQITYNSSSGTSGP